MPNHRQPAIAWICLTAFACWTPPLFAADAGQVAAAIQRGNRYLLNHLKDASGSRKSLAAYALIKTGVNTSEPAIQDAIANALKEAATFGPGQPAHGPGNGFGHAEYAYSVPCHMFLLEAVDGGIYKPQLTAMAGYLTEHQLANGSWFYVDPPADDSGDTSQLQFALLGLWAASRADVEISPEAWQKAMQWLIRTQNSDGGFSYQPTGTDPSGRNTSITNTIGATGSLLVTRHIFYSTTQFGDELAEMTKPKQKRFGVLDRLQDDKGKVSRPFTIPAATLDKTISRALRVIDEKFRVSGDQYLFQMYLLYSMERTAALLNSEKLGKHDWYDQASDEILKLQLADGSWSDRSGIIPATSFALLALNKTTSKLLGNSPAKKVGGGLLAGARGLPGDLSKLQLKEGQAVDRKSQGAVDDLLAELEKVQDVSVEDLQRAIVETVNLDDPQKLIGESDRLQRLSVDPRAEVRRTALWAIGRTGDVRLAPLLIEGLQDEDLNVALEASFGLTILSRKPTGLVNDKGSKVLIEPLDKLSEDATEAEQQAHIQQWRLIAVPAWTNWYLSVRPYNERNDRLQLKKR